MTGGPEEYIDLLCLWSIHAGLSEQSWKKTRLEKGDRKSFEKTHGWTSWNGCRE